MSKGKFIVLEGQGFSGKTEQSQLLSDKLRLVGIEVITTQEPGGVPQAIAIREEVLKRREAGDITPEEEVKLFYQAREEFLKELVLPSLEQGRWIVSTRFSASTFVYQGYERGYPMDFIEEYEEKVVDGHQPDLYLLIDVTEEEIMNRLNQGKREKHGYNEADFGKIKVRREGYLKLANANKDHNWEIIDGNKSIEQVHLDIWEAVKEKFKL